MNIITLVVVHRETLEGKCAFEFENDVPPTLNFTLNLTDSVKRANVG